MSPYSTLMITRKTARALYAKHALDPSDEDLERWLDQMLEPKVYNARLVSDDEENNDDALAETIL